jgi:RNA polymerase sigma factor (sigma-70 family)
VKHVVTPGHFASYEHFRNWIRRCAVNHVRDEFRKGRRVRPLEEADVAAAAEPLMDAEETRNTRQCWDNLNDRDRTLLTRHFIEGRTYDEMADEFLPADGRSERSVN